ncbi:acid protease [Thozetella sp. PMI_491]|nr:acid protease [Thozetella sp. PMI_491]
MHTLSQFLVAAGLSASIIEAASTAPKRFSIPARRLGSGLQRREGNAVDATQHVVVDFTFGGQPIPVALDSGSSFTYVASTLDEGVSSLDLPAVYNPNISTTFRDDNPKCGNPSLACFMGADDVATGGLTAKDMVFGVVTNLSKGVFASGQSATMGLGRQANSPSTWLTRDQPFWLRVGADLEMPYLFATDLYQDRNGTIDFGYIDTTKYTGEIIFVPMNTTKTNWNFQMYGFSIGNGSMQTVPEFTGIVDTGGPNMGLPSAVVDPYFSSFGGGPSTGTSQKYPCSAYPPPDLTLYLDGGAKLVLNGSFLVTPPNGKKSGSCNGRVDDGVQTGYNIGACVFDQKFVVFDHQNSRIGFADKRRLGQSEGVQVTGADSTGTTTTGSPTATGASSTSAKPSSAGDRTLDMRMGSRLSICALIASVLFAL